MKIWCPICKTKKGEQNFCIWTRECSAENLILPYRICGQCRIIGVDYEVIKKTIKDYCERHRLNRITHEILKKEVLSYFQKEIVVYFKSIGYRRVAFRNFRP